MNKVVRNPLDKRSSLQIDKPFPSFYLRPSHGETTSVFRPDRTSSSSTATFFQSRRARIPIVVSSLVSSSSSKGNSMSNNTSHIHPDIYKYIHTSTLDCILPSWQGNLNNLRTWCRRRSHGVACQITSSEWKLMIGNTWELLTTCQNILYSSSWSSIDPLVIFCLILDSHCMELEFEVICQVVRLGSIDAVRMSPVDCYQVEACFATRKSFSARSRCNWSSCCTCLRAHSLITRDVRRSSFFCQ
jgi:hypothetical protein